MSGSIRATSDVFVLWLLGHESRKDLLLDFVNAVLTDSGFKPVCTVEIRNPFNLKTFQIDKASILDIKAVDDNGRIYDLEIQNIGNESFVNRTLYYWARNYADQLKSGEEYLALKPVICINILGFNMFPDDSRIHSCFMAMEKDNPELALNDHFQIHFIELEKLSAGQGAVADQLRQWIDFFLKEGKETDMLKYALPDNPVIQKAHECFRQFTADDELRAMAEARDKAIRDQLNLVRFAENKGREEGARKRALALARRLKDRGMELQEIADVTELPLEEIKRL
jgi:predicted transposase/invertase (TIGR01784 family)